MLEDPLHTVYCKDGGGSGNQLKLNVVGSSARKHYERKLILQKLLLDSILILKYGDTKKLKDYTL